MSDWRNPAPDPREIGLARLAEVRRRLHAAQCARSGHQPVDGVCKWCGEESS